jgi:hypothetical protein
MVATGSDGGGGGGGAAGLDEQLYIRSMIKPKRIVITMLRNLTLLDE